MANPNIVNVSNIFGKTNFANLTTTSATLIVNNPSGSNKVIKINTLIIANIDTGNAAANAVSCAVTYFSNANLGGEGITIVSTTVPGLSSLVPIDKSTAIYLEENTSLGVTGLTANFLRAVCSFEEIS